MSILVDADTRVLVQGITGKMARAHTEIMRAYGTQVVGGVVPGRGGAVIDDLPVFDTMQDAVAETGAETSVVFVPPPFAADAMMEAADAGIRYCACITEGIPAQDMIRVKRYMYRYPRERRMVLTGPNCPGTISPGKALVGVMPTEIYSAGTVGVISRSGTLGYEAAAQLQALGLGVSTAVGIGGDPINGSSFRDMLALFEADPGTDAVLLIGEVGGPQETEAAEHTRVMTKPVAAFLSPSGATKPQHSGHASAIISVFDQSANTETDPFTAAGIVLAQRPTQMGAAVAELLATSPRQ